MRKFFLTVWLLLIAVALHAQAPADSSPFALKSLGHGVYAAIDDAKGDSGANAGFVIGDEAVVVIDTFENENAAKALLAEIRRLTPLPIKFVINTHYHLDHVAGNKIFQDTGAIVIAQTNVLYWIRAENLKFFGKEITPEQKQFVAGFAAPTLLYEKKLVIRIPNIVEVSELPGHTGGDSTVFLADAHVVFCGDLFWRQTLPNLIDASTESWDKTLGQIATNGSRLTYVPGHGDVGNAKDVEAFHQYLSDLRKWVSAKLQEGKKGDSLVEAVLPIMKEKYGNWELFDYFAKSNILDMAAELQGVKRIPSKPLML